MLKSVLLDGVRCFRGEHEIPVRKLTLAVGENSSGKSTFLAMLRSGWDLLTLEEPDFNEPPFALGSYDSIAHYHGGRGKRVASFRLGLTIAANSPFESNRTFRDYRFEATFVSKRGHPTIKEWSVSEGGYCYSVNPSTRGATFKTPNSEFKSPAENRLPRQVPAQFLRQQLAFDIMRMLQAMKADSSKKAEKWLETAAFGALAIPLESPRAIAPIRTHPKRTYDATRGEPSPEGQHVPALLSRYHADPDSREWKRLATELKRFGSASGLFHALEVRHLARKAETGPFQLEFSMVDQQGKRNILDLGYGVSQVLPVLVECLTASTQPLLLQQPEVHLHPKAQAELGSFLARVASKESRQIVVETHSDYLIDRVMLAIREGQLSPDDVCLLFFEVNHGATRVHTCTVNDAGEVDQPSTYREFFLKEQAKVLGI